MKLLRIIEAVSLGRGVLHGSCAVPELNHPNIAVHGSLHPNERDAHIAFCDQPISHVWRLSFEDVGHPLRHEERDAEGSSVSGGVVITTFARNPIKLIICGMPGAAVAAAVEQHAVSQLPNRKGSYCVV